MASHKAKITGHCHFQPQSQNSVLQTQMKNDASYTTAPRRPTHVWKHG